MKKDDFKDVKYVLYLNEISKVYSIYDTGVSLCLVDEEGYEYDDVECDYIIPFDEVTPIYDEVNETEYIQERKILK